MEIKEALSEIIQGRDLSREDMTSVMSQILEGRSTDALIGAFLAALNIKGESIGTFVPMISEAMRVSSWSRLSCERVC